MGEKNPGAALLVALCCLNPVVALAAPVPVLVEMFTSEGCSSCPPADLLLQRLKQAQPAPGVQVITLSEHVDYWNELGWVDPFSSSGITARQQRYASAFRADPYTPQMVVDGRAQFVGSDSRKAIEAIVEAAKAPKANIGLRCGSSPLTLQIRIDNMPGGDADVLVAIAEDALESKVTSGENSGRLMPHASVARRITMIGRMKRQPTFAWENSVALEKNWKRENVSLVVFLQDRLTRHILGAAQTALSACASK